MRKNQLRRQEGQALIMVLLLLPVVIGIALVVVDVSNGFAHRRQLQNIADSAALAGAYDLSHGLSAATAKASAASYGSKNNWPLSDCNGAATATNCYQTPYNGNAGRIEVRVRQDCSDPQHGGAETFFGKAFNFFTQTSGHACLKASARAVAGIVHGPPPPYTFASLNTSCDNHTLVIKLGGILTVLKKIQVNSCSGLGGTKGDAFDIFGAGGSLRDPEDILVNGGWETHQLDLVCVGVDPGGGSDCPGTTYFKCPYFTANVTAGGAPNPAWQPGCPHVGQNTLTDPLAVIRTPCSPLSTCTTIPNSTCSALAPCYSPTEFTTPFFLDASLGGLLTDTTFVADPQKTAANPTNLPGTPFFISIDGERMQVTGKANNATPPFLNKSVTLTVKRGANCPLVSGTQVCNGPSAHNEPSFNVNAVRRATTSATETDVTVSTCTLPPPTTPHNLNIGDWVAVNLTSPTSPDQNGVFAVGEIPDDETNANPCQLEYDYPDNHNGANDFGQANVVAVRRTLISGVEEALVTTDRPTGIAIGDPVIVDITSGDTTFAEELEDGVFVDWVSPDGLSFRYAQDPTLPDVPNPQPTLHIAKYLRFAGKAYLKTVENTATSLAPNVSMSVTLPDDGSFNASHHRVASVGVKAGGGGDNKTFAYANAGPDLPASTLQNAVTAWERDASGLVTLTAPTGGLTAGTTYVVVKLGGAGDTSFDGKFKVTAVLGGPNRFQYQESCTPACPPPVGSTTAPPGTVNGYDNLRTLTSYSRSGGVATIQTSTNHGLHVDEGVIVDVGDSSFNGEFVITSVPDGKTFTYDNPGSIATGTVVASDGVSTNKVTPGAALTASGGLVTVDDALAGGVEGFASAAGTATGPLFEIFNLGATPTKIIASGPATPSEYTWPAGNAATTLQPGVYYGGICIGAPIGAHCGPNVAGTCSASAAAAPTTVTLATGVYVMAGGGFYVCGNATLNTGAGGVMIYNTQDSQALAQGAGKLGQVMYNTAGSVTLQPMNDGSLYSGLTVFQGPDPSGTNGGNCTAGSRALCEMSTGKCDGRATTATDIAFLAASNGLNGIEGTIYAPAENALFTDKVSGTANLAVITGCIYIAGATSTFTFGLGPQAGVAGGLIE